LLTQSWPDFNLDFYTEVQDLSYLETSLNRSLGRGKRAERYKALNKAVCDIVEDFGLVNFETLAVEDKDSMFHLLRIIDKATGYIYFHGDSHEYLPDDLGAYEPGSAIASAGVGCSQAPRTAASAGALFSVADTGSTTGWGGPLDVQERWIDHREEWDEMARERAEKEGKLFMEEKILNAANKVLNKKAQPEDL
jgi:GPN-loop GTPase